MFQAEDGIRDKLVTGVQTCALPIYTPIGYLIPGLSLHDELIQLTYSGFSNLEALKTATYNPAVYFGLEKTLGRIKVGYEADLVLLNKRSEERRVGKE